MLNEYELAMSTYTFFTANANYFICNSIAIFSSVFLAYFVRKKSLLIRICAMANSVILVFYHLFHGALGYAMIRKYFIDVAGLVERGEPVLKTTLEQLRSSGVSADSEVGFSFFSDPVLVMALLFYLLLIAGILFAPDLDKDR